MARLINNQSNVSIELPYDLYPIDDLNWSPVAATGVYTLSGAYDVQQAVKLAGKPMTLQSNDGLGLITRDTVNKLHAQAAIPEATFTLEYAADGVIKIVNVMFDHTSNPIEAEPFKGFNSPNLDDYFAVTLKFKTV